MIGIAKVVLFLAIIFGSILLVIGDYDFPTYPAGMLLGGCIFIIVFPFLYEPFYKKKNNKSFVKLWFKIIFSDK